ncbi:MAG: hypothetical protein HYZ31_12600 [Gammaproteobacteria bacterium]|nr:hypothetical protein [Gammaproteobacteria bacterium]
MKKQYLLVAACITTLFSATAQAALSYSYVEGAYISSDLDIEGFSVDGDGVSLSGSAAVTPNIAINGYYETLSYDYGIDLDSLSIGVTFHTPLAAGTDFVAGIDYLDAEFSIDGFGSEDDTGNVLSAGVRHELSNTAELEANIVRVDIFEETDTGFAIGLLMDITGTPTQVGFGFSDIGDETSLKISARLNF